MPNLKSKIAMNEQVYTNYRLQLPHKEVLGTLVVRDGLIADIQPGVVTHGLNGQGDYLMPGLIELHTDNLERCVSPRPGIRWPLEAAVYHDRDLASAGVTTVCDAIAIGDIAVGSPRLTNFAPMIDVICRGQKAGRFCVEHRIHLRCELAYDKVYEITAQYVDNPLLSMISLMDHTPGQRQFIRLDKFKQLTTFPKVCCKPSFSWLTKLVSRFMKLCNYSPVIQRKLFIYLAIAAVSN
jgi:alpha-D-ribose 1-methylphosphonate 5-triphosphate diphosphatase